MFNASPVGGRSFPVWCGVTEDGGDLVGEGVGLEGFHSNGRASDQLGYLPSAAGITGSLRFVDSVVEGGGQQEGGAWASSSGTPESSRGREESAGPRGWPGSRGRDDPHPGGRSTTVGEPIATAGRAAWGAALDMGPAGAGDRHSAQGYLFIRHRLDRGPRHHLRAGLQKQAQSVTDPDRPTGDEFMRPLYTVPPDNDAKAVGAERRVQTANER